MSYGEITWYSIAAGEGRGRRGKRTGGIKYVIPLDPKVGGFPGGGMPGQGKNPGKSKRISYVL